MRSEDPDKLRILSHFSILDLLLISNKTISDRFLSILDSLLLRKQLFSEMIMTKGTKNSLDLHYIYSKSLEVQNQLLTFTAEVREFLNRKGEILKEYQDVSLTKSMAPGSYD